MAEEAIRERQGIGARELSVMQFLDSILEDAAPPEHLAATEEIFDSGYLDEPLELPA